MPRTVKPLVRPPCSTGLALSLTGLELRPLHGSDRQAFAAMFERLSAQSRLRRYFSPKPALTPRELRYLTDVDHISHVAIAALDAADGAMVGVARYATYAGASASADVAVEVVDDWQRRGLGTLLTARVVERACANGFTLLRASTMWENAPARALLRRLGFRATGGADGLIELELELPLQRAA